ncbi:unnamed protein product [Gongylonema pulchrum]|uniref:Uncharacterized protein n=1 Tax=Gongylonema pulchrum TaxID=637853 RepID=A0A3P6PWI6_9BILA|nr:unnamed protein product [Gongylonema pulchrum]
MVEEDENTEPPYSGTVTPTTTLKRAKESFLLRQNVIFREYEEQVMDTGAEGSGQAHESDAGEEIPSGASDLEEESRNLADEEELRDSSKEYIEFSTGHSERTSSYSLSSGTESPHPVVAPAVPENFPAEKDGSHSN